MLLIPSELSNQQLLQVQPEMTMERVIHLISEPLQTSWDLDVLVEEPTGYRFTMTKKGKFWKPTVSASVTGMFLSNEPSKWIGITHLLLVDQTSGIVTKTWLLPISCTGGGILVCIHTFKQYWDSWRK